MMSLEVSSNSTWIIKGIMKARKRIPEMQNFWMNNLASNKFTMGEVYRLLSSVQNHVVWYDMIIGNNARPRVATCLWLSSHRRLATKDRLAKWGLITDTNCCLCNEVENLDHLFFVCTRLN